MSENYDGINVSTLYLSCEDWVEVLKVDKIKYSDDETEFNIAILDSYLGNKNTVLQRIKRAFKILCGKPIYYADISVSNKRMKDFVIKLNNLVLEEEEEEEEE